MINLKNPNKSKRNTMYLVDKNGEFCIEFINNENNNKKFGKQNSYIIDENTSLVELEQIKQRLESNILEKKQKLEEKEKLKNRNNLFQNEGFQFTLRGEKEEKKKNNFEESKRYNKSIIYKSNNFDNLFNLKHKKIFRNHSVSNLYKNNILSFFTNNNSDFNLNRKITKKNISNSNIDLTSRESNIQNLKNLMNSTNLNTNDIFYSSQSSNRKNYLFKNKSLENKKKRNVNNFYITDKYCEKMVGMNLLSLSSSKYIKNLNEKNIGQNKNDFYYNKMLNDLENYRKKNK